MTAGAVASIPAILKRWQWEENNVLAAIMLDWDDVQAVATRALALVSNTGNGRGTAEDLLHLYREKGATHLSVPELTLQRLLDKGDLSVAHGSKAGRVYLRAQTPAVAELVTTELQARLPHLQVQASQAKNPLISFVGDLPAIAEVGLGFDPAHVAAAHQVGLSPVARPIGYSWVQPDMIERTLDQAAQLGVKMIAFQGKLIPGHEFKIQSTVEAMRRNRLRYAYFRESRHQKGDWFLAKELAGDGLTILAHEFEPSELLDEDWFTISYRWANLAKETGVRLCSVRFFKILHAADPLESLAYIEELAGALTQAGFLLGRHLDTVDLTPYQPERDPATLACAGLSAAGAVGLASDLLPVPDKIKLAGIGAAAVALTGLPFLEKMMVQPAHTHDHDHNHDPDHDHNHHHHDHDHNHDHHHDHGHSHDRGPATAYAPKGLALASTIAYPAAAVALNGNSTLTALGHALAVTAAGATALTSTTAETEYLIGIEEYRGYNLDWLIPIAIALYHGLFNSRPAAPPIPNSTSPIARLISQISNRLGPGPQPPAANALFASLWRWLPLAGLALTALKTFLDGSTQDLPAAFDREHRHAHTHHLSAFQRVVGDTKMALSLKPLRKWTLLGPLGAVSAAWLKRNGRDELATVALTAVAAGEVATLTGFRNGQRPLLITLSDRARSWGLGALLAFLIWLVIRFFNRKN